MRSRTVARAIRRSISLSTLLVTAWLLPAPVAEACPVHKTRLLATAGYFPDLSPGSTALFDALVVAEIGGADEVPALVSRAVDGAPSEVGAWRPPEEWPVMAGHAIVLPNGRLLQYSYPEFANRGSAARIWRPGRTSFTDVSWDVDLFCSGHAFLPDGKVYVTGGNSRSATCETQGRRVTHLFDPSDASWTRGEDMETARWYPATVALGDGRVLITSGLDENCEINPKLEIYTPGKGLEVVEAGRRGMELYPRMHLLPSGKVAHVGPEPVTFTYDPKADRWERVGVTRSAEARFEGTSFMVPGKPHQIMICGGFRDYDRQSTATCERIDFSKKRPRWRRVASMNLPRAHPDAVILPNGKVLMVGGGATSLYQGPVLNAEIYDPETDSWELLPSQVYSRMYHSTAVLLPDGRVMSAGQDDPADDGVTSGDWAEIYEPAYLFRGARPKIGKWPRQVAYDASFTLRTKRASSIEKVILIRPAAMTHSVNNSQRYVELDFEHTGGNRLSVTSPRDGNLAPPGYYMMFIVDGDDVPSKARMVQLVL